MRILTWNINGIRTIPQYHPWNTFKSHDDILRHLEGDIINFQEVKSTRSGLPPSVALPPSYDAFYSFPLQKSGYSGVSTYTRRPSSLNPPSDEAESRGAVPLKAEEGLTGILEQPHLKPSLSAEERVSRPSAYAPSDPDLDLPIDLRLLDSEGRVLTLDFGLFVLINVYCPNDGSSEDNTARLDYKMAFHRLLEARIRALIAEGREVILLGDLNACAAVIDHCEGAIIVKRGLAEGYEGEEYFWEDFQARRWLRDLLHGEKRCMVDIVREFHPDRKGMFTCWNTKLSARASNYGTRIDYILITPGLVPWVKAADIEPGIKGSDHCPVWIELHEEITVSENGEQRSVNLRDQMFAPNEGNIKERDPPRLATKFWTEYSGKQRRLDTFFGAGAAKKKNVSAPATESFGSATPSSLSTTPVSVEGAAGASNLELNPSPQAGAKRAITLEPSSSASSSTSSSTTSSVGPETSPKRRKHTHTSQTSIASSDAVPQSSTLAMPASGSSKLTHQTGASLKAKGKAREKAKPLKSGQSKLSSFFAPSGAEGAKGKARAGDAKESKSMRLKGKGTETGKVPLVKSKNESIIDDANAVDLTAIEDDDPEDVDAQEVDDDADYRLAIQLSLSQSLSASTTTSATTRPSGTPEAWKTLLKPPEPPRCTVHNEVAREFRVNKPGVNKGRSFWVCARPVGPGYDAGRSRRPRDEVDPRWKCNFFVWSSDAKRGRTGSSSGKGDEGQS